MDGTARPVRFELCAASAEAVRIADECGADRVELCANLAVGGTTPSLAMVRDAIRSVSIPVHVLIRPRAGDFVYSREEFALMQSEIREAKAAGASGVVLGVLMQDGSIDVDRTRALVETARPMKVTFHRAFDEVLEPEKSLEAVITAGVDWLLTSGGETSAMEGAETIARLVRQANERIKIMAAGGLGPENVLDLIGATGVEWVHGSLLRNEARTQSPAGQSITEAAAMPDLLRVNLREVVRLLRAANAGSIARIP